MFIFLLQMNEPKVPGLISILFSYILQFLDQDRIVTASSTGAVTIFRHHQNSQV